MGLIKAGLGAVGGNLADQWKEYFYCEAMPENVIAVKGEKRIGGRTSNTKGTDNIISRGSVIAVADGQFMMIVAEHLCRRVRRKPERKFPQHRETFHLRRRTAKGPARVLFQHKRAGGE